MGRWVKFLCENICWGIETMRICPVEIESTAVHREARLIVLCENIGIESMKICPVKNDRGGR
jgi:hypothetical protein